MFERTYNIKAVPASRPRVTRSHRVYYTKTYTKFREDWQAITRKDWPAIQVEMENTHEYAFNFEIYFAKHPRADLDNITKALQDSLMNASAILDDNFCTDLHGVKHSDTGLNQIKLRIWRIK
ncbi:RusA family crossover junction endodeoxyribonuclease [Oenococcus sicerae]|uniref:RusA family crossover junction endodeoxyribonuclease n=1 Tax=Oenococcus sicerae TaxID=2203724 RepID=UPI0039ECC5A5